jgi:hypothetical protein
MVDRRRADAVDEAAARFADTLAESYRIVYEQAAEAQERQARFAREFSERVLEHLREQTEGVRAVSEALADQARRQQAAGQELAQVSVDAYVEFLDTAFSGYQTGVHRATGSAQEEGARAVSRFSDYVLGTAADATRATAESAAGQPPPIDGYDGMDVGELTERLGDLTVEQLQEVKHYEERNKKRETLIEEIDRRLTGSA